MSLTIPMPQNPHHLPSKLVLLAALLFTPAVFGAPAMTDPSITARVEHQLRLDPGVPRPAIKVRTYNGIVTLSGAVSHMLAKERAARVAESVRGVRAVINRIEVAPVVDISADALAASVTEALLYDAATNGFGIVVQANDRGRVTLQGTLDSAAQRDLAEAVAQGVRGVTSINNLIIVRPESPRADSQILPEVRQGLHWDALVDDALIDVRVSNGEVYLSGRVGSAAEKRRATRIARVDGVKLVHTKDLRVVNRRRDRAGRADQHAGKSDLEIREAVRDALLQDPRIRPFSLDVKVTDGRVTLRGAVDTVPARRAAERNAHNTVGVVAVSNLVKLEPKTDIGDQVIARQVHKALLRNPVTMNYDIAVKVKQGVAKLNGEVNSYFEKAAAENVAFRAQGVTKVRNLLAVKQPEPLNHDPYVDNWSIYDYPWYDRSTVIGAKSDQEIRQAIENELLWSPFVDGIEIHVEVEAGTATLSGTVDSLREYRAARDNAYEGGARRVVNQLRIRLLNERVSTGAAGPDRIANRMAPIQ